MRFSINRDDALAAISFARAGILRRSTIPILSSLRVTAAEGAVRFTGTDLDVEASREAVAEVSEAGDLALDAERLNGALQSLPSGAEVAFSLDPKNGRVAIAAGRVRFQIPSEPASGFPAFTPAPEDGGQDVPATDLLRLLDATEFAAGREATRPYMMGVYFHQYGGRWRAVSSNGASLSLTDVPVSDVALTKPQIVPLRAAALLRDLAKSASTVRVSQTDALFYAATDTARMASKVIDQAFPDYARILPQTPHLCQFPRVPFAAGLARCIAISEARTPAARIVLAGGEMVLSARGERGEEAEDAFAATADADLNAAFNARYLLDIANSFSSDDLTLGYSDAISPVSFSNPDDPARLAVIIALRGS